MIRSVRGYEEFVNLVKARRRELRQSLLQASKEVGVSQSTLSVFERKRSISDESVVAIAKWVSVDYQSALRVKKAYFANKGKMDAIKDAINKAPLAELIEERTVEEPAPLNVTMHSKPEVKPVTDVPVVAEPGPAKVTLGTTARALEIKKIRRSASLNTVLLIGLIATLLGGLVMSAGAYVDMQVESLREHGVYAMAVGFGYLSFGVGVLLFCLVNKVLDEVRGE